MRSGPQGLEQNKIRSMVAGGASLDDLKKAFPDIMPKALEAWWKSLLDGEKKPEKKKAKSDPLE